MGSSHLSLCSILSIENQVALSKALLVRHPTTVEYCFSKRDNLQLLCALKGDKIFSLLEQMIDKVLIKEYNYCRVRYYLTSESLPTDPSLIINLGCALDYELDNIKSDTMAAPSGSVTRITQKLVALRATMTPNTCPADLASISQGYIVISLGYEPAAPNEQLPLRYHLRAQEGIQNVHKDAVTERARLLTGLWPQLPVEISQCIIKQLDARGLMTFARLSKGINAFVYRDNKLWQDVGVNHSYSKGLMLANSHRKLTQREMKRKVYPEVMAFVVVLGSHHIDAGFAGDDMPEVVSPSLLCQTGRFGQAPRYFAGQETKFVANGTNLPVIKDKQVLNTEYMLHLVEQAFVAHSCASPDEQPLLLAASARVQISDRLLYECMERFNVPAIATAESEILALYSHGQTDGVVVDVGYECTIIIPIVEGFAVRADMRVVPVGGRHVTLELMKRIQAKYPALYDLTEEEANHIKENYCYFKTSGALSLLHEGDREVLIRGECYHLGDELHECCEVLFNSPAFGIGTCDFKTLFSSSLESLEHNMPRPKVRNHVVLAGAPTLLPGYVQRFREIVHAFDAATHSWSPLNAMMERGYVAWIGGSILGSLTCQNNFWLSKEQLELRLF